VAKQELRRALYMLFATYGPVLDVVAVRGSMRGQAHVVFRDAAASSQALRALQGCDFFGRAMVRPIPYPPGTYCRLRLTGQPLRGGGLGLQAGFRADGVVIEYPVCQGTLAYLQ